jgi:hypothetical protein
VVKINFDIGEFPGRLLIQDWMKVHCYRLKMAGKGRMLDGGKSIRFRGREVC